MKQFFRIFLLLAGVLILVDANAQNIGVHQSFLGAGNAWNVGNAYTGTAIGQGLIGGVRNPAGYYTNRNELLGEGDLFNAFSKQSGVGSPAMHPGPGMLGYLLHTRSGCFAFSYVPVQRLKTGAEYSYGELVSDSNVNALEFAYATPVTPTIRIGAALRYIMGYYKYGFEGEGFSEPTKYSPELWGMRLGVQGIVQGENNRSYHWGIAFDSPCRGVVETAVYDLSNHRSRSDSDYTGTTVVHAGGAVISSTMEIEVDISYTFDTKNYDWFTDETIVIEGNNLDPYLSAGGAIRFWVREDARMSLGIRNFSMEDAALAFLLVGIGGEYYWMEDFTIYGGIGYFHPLDYNYMAIEDVRPFDLRIGVVFHGE